MKVRVLVAAVIAFGLFVPAAYARPAAHHHESVSQRLRAELHATRAKLANADAALAASDAKTAQLQATLAQTEATLTQTRATLATTQTALSSEQQEVATLQAALAAVPTPPTPLSVAVAQVSREVDWADGNAAVQPGQMIAEAAMDYVVGHVSTAAYGYLELMGDPLPGTALSDVDTVLGEQAGICGHATRVFAAIVANFGLPVRGVYFIYNDPDGKPDGHQAAEVYYQGGWHFFDPTFGQFFTDASGNVLSITDARAGSGVARQKDMAEFTNLVEDPAYNGDDTWFETDPATTVQLDAPPLP